MIRRGFTVVELLIVIVVIGILAALTIIAYTNVQNNARAAVLKSDLEQGVKSLELYKYKNAEQYPVDQAAAEAAGLKSSSGVSLFYQKNAATNRYCITESSNYQYHFVTSVSKRPAPGSCDGLVGWWPFNGDTEDYSVTANTTINYGAVSATGQNSASGAYDFNGSTAYVDCGTDAALRPNNVSVSAWVYLDAYSSGMSGIVNYGGGGYWLKVNYDGPLSFYISTAGIDTPVSVSTGTWHHLAGTYTATGTLKIYIDGTEVTNSTTLSGYVTNYSGLRCLIGTVKNVAGRYTDGRIDDVRIYDRVLNGSEVRYMFDQGAY